MEEEKMMQEEQDEEREGTEKEEEKKGRRTKTRGERETEKVQRKVGGRVGGCPSRPSLRGRCKVEIPETAHHKRPNELLRLMKTRSGFDETRALNGSRRRCLRPNIKRRKRGKKKLGKKE